MSKICRRCHVEKAYDSFYRDKNGRNGLRSVCKTCDINKAKCYNVENKDKHRDAQRKWRASNKELDNKRCQASRVKRLSENVLFRISNNIGQLIRKSLQKIDSIKDSQKTTQILSCSIHELKLHLESKFQSGMNWANYGEWHIDHTCPVSQALDKSEVLLLNHYSNLRPLWAADNFSKGDRPVPEALEMCLKLLKREWIDV